MANRPLSEAQVRILTLKVFPTFIDRIALARASWALSLQTALMLRKKAALSDAEFTIVMMEAAAMFEAATDSSDVEARIFLIEQSHKFER
jgi:hypothetical protein